MLRGEFTQRNAETNLELPHYEININIDDAKLNQETNAATITPILGRLHSIQPTASRSEGIVILSDTSVFVIGFYVGNKKPENISSFLDALMIELCHLSPLNVNVECTEIRCFTVSLRCVIVDGPMRSYLKRTKGHTGHVIAVSRGDK
jgi:hypothetical protein